MPEGSIEIPIVFLGHRTIAFLYSDASVSPKLNAVLADDGAASGLQHKRASLIL